MDELGCVLEEELTGLGWNQGGGRQVMRGGEASRLTPGFLA